MNAKEIVKMTMTAIEAGNSKEYEMHLANNFVLSGPVPQPLGKREFVTLMKNIHAGVPNWKFNATNLEGHGDKVHVTVQITGKQTRTLPGLFPGMTDLPATDRSFSLPKERLDFTVEGDRITKIQVEPVPGGGVPGILAQLGIKVPAM